MRFKTLDDWLAWQSSLHSTSIDLGLDRVARVFERLGLTAQLPSITVIVAGTNGKGSTIAFLEQMLLSAGYSTLVYTSPHIDHYTERLRWCGQTVENEHVWCSAFDEIDQAREGDSLTYFEFSTLAALLIAKKLTPDVCILEVGLGGRLDAVNLVSADATIITNVQLDHCDWLGPTRETIGREKAGVFRPFRPAIYAEENVPSTVKHYAEKLKTPLLRVGREYNYEVTLKGWTLECFPSSLVDARTWDLPFLRMAGEHQLQNAAAAIIALHSLASRLSIPLQSIKTALANATLPGRCEILPGPVLRIIDVSHNQAAIRRLTEVVATERIGGRTVAIFGMMRRKDVILGIEPIISIIDHWIIPDSMGEDMFTADELIALISARLPKYATIEKAQSMIDALVSAHGYVRAGDILTVFGSFRMVELYYQIIKA